MSAIPFFEFGLVLYQGESLVQEYPINGLKLTHKTLEISAHFFFSFFISL